MITAKLFQNEAARYWGFQISGHADYAEVGEDIICAAVSALALNTINSIEALTPARPDNRIEEGFLRCQIWQLKEDPASCPQASLLLDALALGLQSLVESYGTEYLCVSTIQI